VGDLGPAGPLEAALACGTRVAMRIMNAGSNETQEWLKANEAKRLHRLAELGGIQLR
jgi:hypothetical protein